MGNADRRGSVLLLVLVVVAVLIFGTGTYLQLMQNEGRAVRRHGRGSQAMRLAESGAVYLKAFTAQTLDKIQTQGGLAANAKVMQAVLVDDQSGDFDRGRFTVMAPDQANALYGGVRYGLEDESGKLNLNVLLAPGAADKARNRLLALPGMTIEIADAILDWLDADSTPRENGAEGEYYSGLTPPYSPRNGPIADLDELLLVKGVTPELLYGVDQNRNYFVDETERPRGALLQIDNADGVLNRGWWAYLTVFSVEGMRGPAGGPRLDLNGGDLKQLYTGLQQFLDDGEAKFIIAYRQNGGGAQPAAQTAGTVAQQPGAANGAGGATAATGASATASTGQAATTGAGGKATVAGGTQSATTVQPGTLQLDFTKPATTQINTLLDLVGAKVQIPGVNNAPGQTVESPWKADASSYQKLMKLYDSAMAGGALRVAGRVNVNAASRPVLTSIPNLPPGAVDAIISRRQADQDYIQGEQRQALWLLVDGLVTLDQMKQIEPYVTARGDAYSGQIAGFFDAGPTVARAEFVLDRSAITPRLRAWRPLASLGPGFSLDLLGATGTDSH